MRAQVITYYLELTNPAQLVPSSTPHPPFTLVQAQIPCPPLNRFLYATVGGQWYWVERLGWTYREWQGYVERECLETWIAYVSGTPAGYYELELQSDANVQIVYFGLLPQFVGQGLGGTLLTTAVERAWAMGARRVWVHTCTSDHPSALPGYQARGFRIYDEVLTEEDLPEEPVGPWPGSGF